MSSWYHINIHLFQEIISAEIETQTFYPSIYKMLHFNIEFFYKKFLDSVDPIPGRVGVSPYKSKES